MKEILKFNEAMQRFTKLIVRFTHFKDKNKLKYFARWYHQTFELRTEVRRMIKSKIESDFKDTSQREKLIREFFSTKNLFRLQARVFQTFSKWKMMMKYNYPFMNRKLSRVFGLIPNKVHELNRKMIMDATAPVDRKMFERRVPRTKISDLNLIDSISFYRKFSNGLYCLMRMTHRNLEELFVSFRLLEFPHENKNVKILEERHVSKKNLRIKPNGTRERPKVSELVPKILAEQSFLNSYRRALVSGLKRLQSQVKISEKEHRLKEVREQILNFRTRARVDLIRRVYSALYNRLQTRSLLKWHFQTEIRKAAGTRDEAKTQLMVKERALYTRIKEEVEQLASRYTVSLTRIVVRKLKDEKDDNMINLLKEELDKLVLELLDKL